MSNKALPEQKVLALALSRLQLIYDQRCESQPLNTSKEVSIAACISSSDNSRRSACR